MYKTIFFFFSTLLDYYFTCPTNYFAQKFAEHGMNVYYYHFTQVLSAFDSDYELLLTIY